MYSGATPAAERIVETSAGSVIGALAAAVGDQPVSACSASSAPISTRLP